MNGSKYLNPAHRVVSKLGRGIIDRNRRRFERRPVTVWHYCLAVAGVVNLHPSMVYRWMRPRELGGTDGIVPDHHQHRLLNFARQHQLDLNAEDFFCGQVEPEPQPSEVSSGPDAGKVCLRS